MARLHGADGKQPRGSLGDAYLANQASTCPSSVCQNVCVQGKPWRRSLRFPSRDPGKHTYRSQPSVGPQLCHRLRARFRATRSHFLRLSFLVFENVTLASQGRREDPRLLKRVASSPPCAPRHGSHTGSRHQGRSPLPFLAPTPVAVGTFRREPQPENNGDRPPFLSYC